MASVVAGAMAEKMLLPDSLPLLFKSIPVVGPVLGDAAIPFLTNPPIVAGVATHVMCKPRDTYEDVSKYFMAGGAGYVGGMLIKQFLP
jgi:hypothetical protein